MKRFVAQIVTSLFAIGIWEFLAWVLRSFKDLDMDHIGIANPWFIVFFISVNLLFWGFSNRRNKFSPYQNKRYGKKLLNELNNLKSEIENGFASIDECIRWTHKVIPLIEFDPSCSRQFENHIFLIKYSKGDLEKFIHAQKNMALTLNEAVEKLKILHNNRFHVPHPKSSSNDHI